MLFTAILAKIKQSAIWQGLAAFVFANIALLLIILESFRQGKDAQRRKQEQAAIDALRKRGRTDDEVAAMPDDKRRSRLSKWVRGDGRD